MILTTFPDTILSNLSSDPLKEQINVLVYVAALHNTNNTFDPVSEKHVY